MNAVGNTINAIEIRSDFLRPYRSPIYPKIQPPINLAANPVVNAAKVSNKEMYCSFAGKNNRLRIVAKYPYNAKSYHSMTFPVTVAAINLSWLCFITSAHMF